MDDTQSATHEQCSSSPRRKIAEFSDVLVAVAAASWMLLRGSAASSLDESNADEWPDHLESSVQ